jgi:hypothetical protein
MRFVLALATAAAVSACSNSRDRGTPVTDDGANTARDLRIARADTAGTRDSLRLASRDTHPVSPAEQTMARTQPAPAAKKPVRRRSRPASPAKPSVDTIAARGYAPIRPADSAVSFSEQRDPGAVQPVDSAPATDTAAATREDSARSGAPSQVRATASATEPDTSATASAADSGRLRSDTLAAVPTPPTVASASTSDTTGRDTTPTPADTAQRASQPTIESAANAAAATVSRRTLPIGTEIHAALDDSINSRRDSVGRSITAQVSENVTGAGGRILIPAGTTVRLTVTRLASSKSKNSPGRLGLRVDGLQLGGELQRVQAELQPVPRELRGRGVTGSDAAKVGAGAAGGAVLGGVITGKTKGAVIGGVVGAAGGAVVASQTATRDVVVKAKTPLVFVLTAPLVAP